jgi:lipopolysaccharide transport protein LptA
LRFGGAVRAWQGPRHLGGERIVIDQRAGTLVANEQVTTRLPRDTSISLAETDFIHVSAAELNYDDREVRAVYSGTVRVRLTEGWLETRRLEIELVASTRRVREVRATGEVELALTSRRGGADPPQQVDGQGDRLAYAPGDGIVRLFGDQAPATVRRIGADGLTTSGRILRYDLAMGTIEVEAGSRGPARISTPGA